MDNLLTEEIEEPSVYDVNAEALTNPDTELSRASSELGNVARLLQEAAVALSAIKFNGRPAVFGGRAERDLDGGAPVVDIHIKKELFFALFRGRVAKVSREGTIAEVEDQVGGCRVIYTAVLPAKQVTEIVL